MEKYIDILSAARIFRGISKDRIAEMLENMRIRVCEYGKDDMIQWEQSSIDSIGIILNGRAVAYRSSAAGNNIVMNHLKRSDVFADIIAASEDKLSPVNIRALEPTSVLFIEYSSFIGGRVSACSGYEKLMHNYIETISQRYFALQDRISCLILPSLREKILYYLKECSVGKQGEPFEVPYDRASMAEYLNADRSALSRELSNLKKDGYIDYYKNTFKLLR